MSFYNGLLCLASLIASEHGKTLILFYKINESCYGEKGSIVLLAAAEARHTGHLFPTVTSAVVLNFSFFLLALFCSYAWTSTVKG